MIESETLVLLYVPCSTKEEAVRIGTYLVNERLIACANTFESQSIYRWKGKIQSEAEAILLCKTTSLRAFAAEKRIRELHSYDLPCIMTLKPASVNYDYAKWVAGEVSQSATLAGAHDSEVTN
ncbi:MAG: divalent-cation tolerance protein CutA [Chloroflexi bacterium]|nr:divalent-cation tolerance protein CutA [Chloroflexota bacterium]